jgi:6-phosphogluconate dehydrogenase
VAENELITIHSLSARNMTQKKYDIAVLGLGVMGRNLSLNFADRGISVIASDPFVSAIEGSRAMLEPRVTVCQSPEEAIPQLSQPRRILMMMKAGEPTDKLIERLSKILEPGDILIDGGNTHFRDTEARQTSLIGQGIHLVGLGVSGGETGARHGPALMAGGATDAITSVSPLLSAIAAKTDTGESCYAAFGTGGAGHFVKMAHNGIEYAMMQTFAEIYLLLQGPGGMSPSAIAKLLSTWNAGETASYLLEVTTKVLAAVDRETGKPLVDIIRDKAAHKGTGQWTVEAGLDLGVAVPSIAAAFEARVLSSRRAEKSSHQPNKLKLTHDGANLADDIHAALPLVMLIAYAQGLALIAEASHSNQWKTDLASAAKVWRSGCIIRSSMLEPIAASLQKDGVALMETSFAKKLTEGGEIPLRRVLVAAIASGVPVPVLASSLAYLDGLNASHVGASLIQGQRDYFGAHTFERIDRAGAVRHDWQNEK